MNAVVTIWSRQMTKFFRSPMELGGTLLQPILWMVLFSAAMQGMVGQLTGPGGYIPFVTPGIAALTALSGAVTGGAALLDERLRGIVKEYAVAPIPRAAILVGNIAASTTKALIQSALILLVGLLMGARLQGGPAGWLGALLLLALFGLGSAGIAAAAASKSPSTGAYHGVIFLLNLPVLFASNGLVPLGLLPTWLAWVARFNPVTYLVAAFRQLAFGVPGDVSLALATAVVATFCLLGLWVGAAGFRSALQE